jgi:membrane protease subunit HflK
MKRGTVLFTVGLVGYLATGLHFVQPDEQALVRRCGRALDPPWEPGPHFGLPWGWDRVDRVKPREVKRVTVGPLTLGAEAVGSGDNLLLTGDRNLIKVRASVQFSIQDPAAYLFRTTAVDRLVAKMGEAAVTEVLCRQAVDRALTRGKQELGLLLLNRLQTLLDRYQLGITVRSVDIGGVEPPVEVAEAFTNVISALREREQQINQAHSYANKTLAQAQAEAQRLRDEARGLHERVVRKAQGEAERFEKLLPEYRRSKQLTAQRLYLETLGELLPKLRSKLIIDTGSDLDLSILREEKR